MNLNHLRAFHLVATYGSYSGAARAAGLTQPTLSEQVRSLENKYNARLLQRHGRGVKLTTTGKRLLEASVKVFAAQDEAESILCGVLNLVGAELRFGTDAPIHAVPVMSRMHASHPDISINLRTGNSTSIRAAVIDGTVDIGIMADETPHPLLSTQFLSQQDLVALVRTDTSLGAGKSLAVKGLAHESLIMRETGSITRRAMETALQRAGVKPSAIIETDGREAVHAAVLAGLGVGVIGEDEFNDDPRLVLLDFTDSIPPLTEYIIYRKDRLNDPLITAVLQQATRRMNSGDCLPLQAAQST